MPSIVRLLTAALRTGIMLLSRNSKVPPRQHVPSSSLLAAIEHYPRILGYCVALAPGILLYKYDIVIVGNVSAMPEFQLALFRVVSS